jgi:hypothetical protein
VQPSLPNPFAPLVEAAPISVCAGRRGGAHLLRAASRGDVRVAPSLLRRTHLLHAGDGARLLFFVPRCLIFARLLYFALPVGATVWLL